MTEMMVMIEVTWRLRLIDQLSDGVSHLIVR
jgi:hypothetical protein